MDTFYGPTHTAKNKMTLRLNFAEVSTAWRAVDIMFFSLSWVDIHPFIRTIYHEKIFYCPPFRKGEAPSVNLGFDLI